MHSGIPSQFSSGQSTLMLNLQELGGPRHLDPCSAANNIALIAFKSLRLVKTMSNLM